MRTIVRKKLKTWGNGLWKLQASKVAILIKVSVAENSGGGGGRMKSGIFSVLVKFCFASFLYGEKYFFLPVLDSVFQ